MWLATRRATMTRTMRQLTMVVNMCCCRAMARAECSHQSDQQHLTTDWIAATVAAAAAAAGMSVVVDFFQRIRRLVGEHRCLSLLLVTVLVRDWSGVEWSEVDEEGDVRCLEMMSLYLISLAHSLVYLFYSIYLSVLSFSLLFLLLCRVQVEMLLLMLGYEIRVITSWHSGYLSCFFFVWWWWCVPLFFLV